MQALTNVERMVELYRLLRIADVLDIDMVKPADVSLDATCVKRIIRVAGIASFLTRDAIVLKVRRRYVGSIVHIQTLSMGLHDVAGETELRPFRALNMIFK